MEGMMQAQRIGIFQPGRIFVSAAIGVVAIIELEAIAGPTFTLLFAAIINSAPHIKSIFEGTPTFSMSAFFIACWIVGEFVTRAIQFADFASTSHSVETNVKLITGEKIEQNRFSAFIRKHPFGCAETDIT